MTTPGTAPTTVDAAVVTKIVELAGRAPSLHNSQPWRWVFEDSTLHLFADHTRIGDRTDSAGHQVILSCGVALDHSRVAAAASGWAASIERFPDLHDRDHLASITFDRAAVSDHDRALCEAIRTRRTDRLAFASPEPWISIAHLLESVVEGTVATLDVIDDSGRPALADASRRSEAGRRSDETYEAELDWWAECSGPDDGIPFSAMPSVVEADRVDVARRFPLQGWDNRRPQLDRDHSKVLVLSTHDDIQDDILRCGEVALAGAPGVHGGGFGDLHADAHDRAALQPRSDPDAHRLSLGTAGTHPRRPRTGDRAGPVTDSATRCP